MSGRRPDRPVSRLLAVNVNGAEQWVLIRGSSPHNPVLLFLHGGPGFAQISFAPAFQRELEEHFLVVNWDQRGAGKSYTAHAVSEDTSLESYIADTAELVRWLLANTGQTKAFLVGHSWGSTLGIHAVRRHPELFNAFVGTGFGVQFQEGERLSLQYLLAEAERRGDEKALRRLQSIQFPITEDTFDSYIKEKAKWMGRFGGYFHAKTGPLFLRALTSMAVSRRYSVRDYVRFVQGMRLGRKVARRIILEVDLFRQVPEVDVPVVLCIGGHDLHTPFELARRYFETLRAPAKHWVWFDHSAHSPPFEEPQRFAEVLADLLSPMEASP